jgi:hypothetical protein
MVRGVDQPPRALQEAADECGLLWPIRAPGVTSSLTHRISTEIAHWRKRPPFSLYVTSALFTGCSPRCYAAARELQRLPFLLRFME